MAANTLVQTDLDPAIVERATSVLQRMGLTLSDAVAILLRRTATEGALPFSLDSEPAEYDEWFRAQVQQALNETDSPIPHAEVQAEFRNRRAATRANIETVAE